MILFTIAAIKYSNQQKNKRLNKLNKIKFRAESALLKSRRNKIDSFPKIKNLLTKKQLRNPHIVSMVLDLRSAIIHYQLKEEFYEFYNGKIKKYKKELINSDGDERKEIEEKISKANQTKEIINELNKSYDDIIERNKSNISKLKKEGIRTDWYEKWIKKKKE